MDYRTTIDALIDAAVDVMVDGFADAAASHAETRQQGATLRNQASARALLGPRLDDAVTALANEAIRRAVARYENLRRNPRYSKTQLVDELDDAEAELAKQILAAQKRSSPMPSLSLALALLRAQAIAIAAGEESIIGLKVPRAATRGPMQRRRPMTAADIPAELAQTIFAVARGDDPAGVTAEFDRLDTTPVNLGGIVTKVRLALERGGSRLAGKLADTLRDAGVVEVAPPPADDALTDGSPVGPVGRAAATLAHSIRPSEPQPFQARQARSAARLNGAGR